MLLQQLQRGLLSVRFGRLALKLAGAGGGNGILCAHCFRWVIGLSGAGQALGLALSVCALHESVRLCVGVEGQGLSLWCVFPVGPLPSHLKAPPAMRWLWRRAAASGHKCKTVWSCRSDVLTLFMIPAVVCLLSLQVYC